MLSLQDWMMIVAIVVIIGVGAHAIHVASTNRVTSGSIDVVNIVKFFLTHLSQCIDDIENAADTIGGVDPDRYETEEEYRKELIDTTLNLINSQLYKVGIKSPLSHDTLLNLTEMVIDKVIEEKRKNDKEAAIEAIPDDDDDEDDGEYQSTKSTDISDAFSNFYDNNK